MGAEEQAAEIAALTFEQALAELEGIVKTLERGSGNLDDSIAAYERGALLKRHCEAKLVEARGKIEKISLGPDGQARTEPAQVS